MVVVSGTEGYAEEAGALIAQYEGLRFADVHRVVLHLLPCAGCGAGCWGGDRAGRSGVGGAGLPGDSRRANDRVADPGDGAAWGGGRAMGG